MTIASYITSATLTNRFIFIPLLMRTWGVVLAKLPDISNTNAAMRLERGGKLREKWIDGISYTYAW